MKLVRSNGLVLEVRDCSAVIFRMVKVDYPLPVIDSILEDAQARTKLKELMGANLYRVDKAP